jgi:hypothetical protein
MSFQKAAGKNPTTIAKATTPDETQDTGSGPRFRTWYKGTLTGSEIYERLLPDGESKALRIDGPDTSTILQNSDGQIKLITGQRNKEKGPGSGKLCIHSWGYQAKHEYRSNLEFNAGDDEEDQALNVQCYGDYVEKTTGGTRYIRAQKILIEASEELILIGKTQVTIQSGSAGGGSISLNAGNIEKTTNNDQENILGQRLTFGVSEDTTLSFDPRSNQSIVSPGHVNWKILGDYSQWIGGVSQTIVAGKPGTPPLVKARDTTFSVNSLLGGASVKATDAILIAAGAGLTETAGAAVTVAAGTSYTATAGLNASMIAGGIANITAQGAVNIKGSIILLN